MVVRLPFWGVGLAVYFGRELKKSVLSTGLGVEECWRWHIGSMIIRWEEVAFIASITTACE
jgi:hypothetical protein